MTDLVPPDILAAAVPVVKEALEGLAPTIRQAPGLFTRYSAKTAP
jgi:hypothetical protein